MTNNKTSIFVAGQLPEFIQANNPLFINFIEAYYEFMEQSNTAWDAANTVSQGSVIDRLQNFRSNMDIDTSIGAFSDKLYKEFLTLFPQTTVANRNLILKNAKDFYRSRGTQKSFEFLFRAVYGEEATIYVPNQNILKISDGKWFVDKSLSVITVSVNGASNSNLSGLEAFINTKVTGAESNAAAIVERALISYQNGIQKNELFISNQTRDFISGEMISAVNINGDTLSANVFSGILNLITVGRGGSRYNVGDPAIVETVPGSSGSGGMAFISQVSDGNVANVLIIRAGSGFRANDLVGFFGGGGIGANGHVASVIATGFYHANTYNVCNDVIGFYSNVTMNTANYGFANIANCNANTTFANAFSYWSFSNTGPLNLILVDTPGENFSSVPQADPIGNTRIKTLGIIGTLAINNAGLNYTVNDQITITNTSGGFGYGGKANVLAVNASGSITRTKMIAFDNYIPGGTGYSMDFPPTVNVVTSTGSGANISMDSILGFGSPSVTLQVGTSTIGSAQQIAISNRGNRYNVAPTINLTASGDGTATANANIVSGIYTYPGRFLDESGFPSGFSFIQDRDYYQNYSYVVRVKQSIEDYRQLLFDMIHPAGVKLFGEYSLNETGNSVNNVISSANSIIALDTYYLANAVSFVNSNTYVTKTTPFTGIANSKTGTLSLWFNANTLPANTTKTLMYSGNSSSFMTLGVKLSSIAANTPNVIITIFGANTGGQETLNIQSNTTTWGGIATNTWIHILSSWDTSNTQNTHMYISGRPSCNVVTLNNNTLQLKVNNSAVGAMANSANPFDGCISEVWFSTTWVDLSNTTIRRQFITDQLTPKYQGATGNTQTGITPIIYLNGNAPTFNVNLGTGGNYTFNQTTANCNSSPGTML